MSRSSREPLRVVAVLALGLVVASCSSAEPQTASTTTIATTTTSSFGEVCTVVLDDFEPVLDALYYATDRLAGVTPETFPMWQRNPFLDSGAPGLPSPPPGRLSVSNKTEMELRMDAVVEDSARLANSGSEEAQQVLAYAIGSRNLWALLMEAPTYAALAAVEFDDVGEFRAYESVLERCKALP